LRLRNGGILSAMYASTCWKCTRRADNTRFT
jgi:hypothetical protein